MPRKAVKKAQVSLWKQALRHNFVGKPKFDPAELAAAAAEYFDWIEQNPLIDLRGKERPRPMAIVEFLAFSGIGKTTWYNIYKHDPCYAPVVEWIEAVIWKQKFDAAAAEQLNSALLARDLGLTDKREISGDPSRPVTVRAESVSFEGSDQEAMRAYVELMRGNENG